MPDKLFMPTHPSSPFSHAYTRTHHQPDSSPPGLAQWACYIKASAYGSRVGWTLARTIHTYITRLLKDLAACVMALKLIAVSIFSDLFIMKAYLVCVRYYDSGVFIDYV